MRKLIFIYLSIFALCLFSLPLMAQEAEPAAEETAAEETDAGATEDETETTVDVTTAVWGTYVDEDSSKAEEYGEIPEGFLINHFNADVNMKEGRFIGIDGERVGQNNARYGFEYGLEGRYGLRIDYIKIPHLFSKSGETIWTETAPGVWTLPDSIQRTIQNINPVDPTDPTYQAGLAAQKAFISNLLTGAHPQSLGLQRNRGAVDLTFTPSLNWTYGIQYSMENRDGTRPFGSAFGFSWVTELPERIDYNTQRLRAGVQYARDGKSFVAAYDLSLFYNETETMIWDNPLRIDDRTYSSAYSPGDGTSRGRLQLPVDNVGNTFSFGGASKLGNGRVTGSFAYTLWTDEVELQPFTINTSIEPIPLPATTFNGEMRNINANLRYTVPVGEKGDFSATYRLYDMSNNSDQFRIGEYVRFDQVAEPLHRFDCEGGVCTEVENPPTPLIGYSQNTVDLDFGWSLGDGLKWSAGYIYDRWNREDRDVNTTSENLFKTGIDARLSDSFTLHAFYRYSQRRFDEYFLDNPTYIVIPLRRWDVADRNRNSFNAIADWMFSEKAVLSFSVVYGKDDFVDTQFGLIDRDTYSLGADFSYTLTEKSNVNLWYELAAYNTFQRGRQSGASASTDPNADWTADLEDRYHTFGLGYQTSFREDKMSWDVSTSYALADGDANLFSPPGGSPNLGTSLDNMDETDLFTFRTGVNCKILPRARVGVFYWFESYNIDDFAEDTTRTDLVSFGTILLNGIQPDYSFHSGWVGLIYNW